MAEFLPGQKVTAQPSISENLRSGVEMGVAVARMREEINERRARVEQAKQELEFKKQEKSFEILSKLGDPKIDPRAKKAFADRLISFDAQNGIPFNEETIKAFYSSPDMSGELQSVITKIKRLPPEQQAVTLRSFLKFKELPLEEADGYVKDFNAQLDRESRQRSSSSVSSRFFESALTREESKATTALNKVSENIVKGGSAIKRLDIAFRSGKKDFEQELTNFNRHVLGNVGVQTEQDIKRANVDDLSTDVQGFIGRVGGRDVQKFTKSEKAIYDRLIERSKYVFYSSNIRQIEAELYRNQNAQAPVLKALWSPGGGMYERNTFQIETLRKQAKADGVDIPRATPTDLGIPSISEATSGGGAEGSQISMDAAKTQAKDAIQKIKSNASLSGAEKRRRIGLVRSTFKKATGEDLSGD